MSKPVQQRAAAVATEASGPAWSYTHRGYALRRGFSRLTQSRIGTFLTLIMLGVTLALPAVMLFLLDDADRLPVDTEKGQSITAYLNPSVPDLDGAALAADIARRASVISTDYISRTEALETFREHAEVGPALEVLETNPLPGAIIVYPHIDGQGKEALTRLAAELEGLPRVDLVQMDLVWVDRLTAVFTLAKKLASLLGLLLAATALIVIGNTVRLEMLKGRREMEVAQLLGAKRGFVLRPFLYLGSLYGLLGGAFAILIALTLHSLLKSPVSELARAYGSTYSLSTPGNGIIMPLLALITVLALLVAWITALWRYRGTVQG